MRKRDELTDPNSCMSKARDDEWTFVLLGRDPAAIVAVRAWIEERIRIGKNTSQDAKIIEAEKWIREVATEQAITQSLGR
jgi:predicted phosphohydrolase